MRGLWEGFVETTALTKHAWTHPGEKPYVYVTCGKGFATANHLTTHARTHMGEKPFVCVTSVARALRGLTTSSCMPGHTRKAKHAEPQVAWQTQSNKYTVHTRVRDTHIVVMCVLSRSLSLYLSLSFCALLSFFRTLSLNRISSQYNIGV